jgi:hypothetical protein
VGCLPNDLVGRRADSGARWQRQVHCSQIPHHAARRTDLPKFVKDQANARLHLFVGIEDHFSRRSASQSHRQPLAQFSPFRFVSGSCLHALFELM